MIPKIIHYCWFGRGEMPKLAKKCIKSWKKYCPDYEIKEWNEDNFDVDIIPYTGEAYRKKKYAFVSDYARFWLLYHYGGLYFDTDVEIIRPIEDIIQSGPFMGYEITKNRPRVAAGLGIFAYPHNPFFKKILDYYSTNHFISKRGYISQLTVVDIIEALSNGQIEHKDNGIDILANSFYVYPSDFFCPINYETSKLTITANTRTIHWFLASWVNNSQKCFGRFEQVCNIIIRFWVRLRWLIHRCQIIELH